MASIFSQNLNFGFFDSGGIPALNQAVTLTGGVAANVSDQIPLSTSETFSFALVKANLQLFFAVADQAVTITTSGADTFTLAPNSPMTWYPNSGFSNPFAGNITTLTVHNGAVAIANVDIRSLSTQ